MKKNVLFISIAFPPKLDSECIQTAKYFKYLTGLNKKYSIDVLTSASPTLFMPTDQALASYVKGYRQLVEIKIRENKYLNFLIRILFPTLLQLPDSKFTFYWQWKKATKKIINTPDLIYSRSFPMSSTLMALKLKKYYNVPWVIHLSDPWTESPFQNYTNKARRINTEWENMCFKEANKICFTSKGTISLYIEKYPQYRHKFKIFPNVYDKENVNTGRNSISDKLRFVYTGGLAGSRSPEPILKAIQKLRSMHPTLLDICEFKFSGDIDKKNKTLFSKYQDGSIAHLGWLAYRESTELQNSAHVLLVIDSPSTNNSDSVFFPSKLLDYLSAGRRIFAITSQNSTTHSFLDDHDLGCSFNHTDINELNGHIKECILQFKEKNFDFFNKNKVIEEYEAQFNVNRLDNLFDEII